MAGWNIPNEGTPYYKPVAPEVPQPDNTAAKIISAGTGPAISGFVQMALGRQRADIEQQQMLQQADIEAKKLAFDRDQLHQQHDLAIRGQDIQNKNVLLDYSIQDRQLDLQSSLNDYQKDHISAQTDYLKWQVDTGKKQLKTAFDRNLAYAEQRAQYLEQAGKDADELGLFGDPGDTPMQYAKNALGYQKLYEGTADPKLKATVKMFMDKAYSSKVTLDGPDGRKAYPWAQVVQDIDRDPENSPFVKALRSAGMFDTQQSTETIDGKQVPVTTREPKPVLKKLLQDEKKGNTIKEIDAIKSKANPLAPTNATEAIAAGELGGTPPPNPDGTRAGRLNPGAALPPPDTAPAEKEAAYVKQKIANDPDNAEQYKAVFLQRNPGRDDLLQ